MSSKHLLAVLALAFVTASVGSLPTAQASFPYDTWMVWAKGVSPSGLWDDVVTSMSATLVVPDSQTIPPTRTVYDWIFGVGSTDFEDFAYVDTEISIESMSSYMEYLAYSNHQTTTPGVLDSNSVSYLQMQWNATVNEYTFSVNNPVSSYRDSKTYTLPEYLNATLKYMSSVIVAMDTDVMSSECASTYPTTGFFTFSDIDVEWKSGAKGVKWLTGSNPACPCSPQAWPSPDGRNMTLTWKS
jgi:hypothetical protein